MAQHRKEYPIDRPIRVGVLIVTSLLFVGVSVLACSSTNTSGGLTSPQAPSRCPK